METGFKYSTDFTQEDENFVNSASTEEDKEFRRSVILAALTLNGAYDSALPGIATSYIPVENYVHILEKPVMIVTNPDNSTKEIEINSNMAATIEQAINWHSLGRGKGGLAGASVRLRLRSLFIPNRECTTIRLVTKEMLDITKDFVAYSQTHSKFAGIWHANAYNVLGLAISCFIRECHHWNAQNVKPIKALIGSLSQENDLPENEYRKLFYLSIHPVPLSVYGNIIKMSRDEKQIDISETVKVRLRVAPAGFADLCACAIAAQSYIREDYANRSRITKDVVKLLHVAETLKNNAVCYHPFASSMGETRIEFQKGPFQEAMILLAAYAKTCIGGTLSNSPALNKFTEMHLRRVNTLSKAFKDYNERKSDDLTRILTGEDEIDITNILDKIKPIAKAAEKLRLMSDSPDSPMAKAAATLEEKIVTIVGKMDTRVGEEFDLSDIKPPDMGGPVTKYDVGSAGVFTRKPI